jgi:hypothetical protein
LTEIRRCKVCGVTLCRDNAVMWKHGRVSKLGNLCTQCENDRQREKHARRKKITNKNRNERITDSVAHAGKCSFCGGAIGISTVIENKLYKKRLNCCVKCDNVKNSSHNIYTSIVRGNSYPEFIVGFNSQSEKDDFLFWRNLQIQYSGTAYGSRVSKVGQNTDHVVVSEDKDGTVSYATEIQRCVEKKVVEDGSTIICVGLLRYDHREVLHCTKCNLCY